MTYNSDFLFDTSVTMTFTCDILCYTSDNDFQQGLFMQHNNDDVQK